MILLGSAGDLYRLSPDNRLVAFARLPRGQYLLRGEAGRADKCGALTAK